jgi:hypothetical protein
MPYLPQFPIDPLGGNRSRSEGEVPARRYSLATFYGEARFAMKDDPRLNRRQPGWQASLNFLNIFEHFDLEKEHACVYSKI